MKRKEHFSFPTNFKLCYKNFIQNIKTKIINFLLHALKKKENEFQLFVTYTFLLHFNTVYLLMVCVLYNSLH